MQEEPTIYDIAKELNLAPSTISRALNNHPAISDETKERVLALAKKLGYRTNTFASKLRSRYTHTLGVIVPYIDSSFVSSVIGGIETVANDYGYNILIHQSLESYEKEIKNVQTMFDNRVDGLIVSLAAGTIDTSHFLPFIEKKIPLFFFDRVDDALNCPQFIIDNYTAGYNAAIHLTDQNCRNIVHITGNLNRNVYSERLKGFKQALSDKNIIFNDTSLFTGKMDLETGKDIASMLLARDSLPDGIFVSNDICAMGCMSVLKKAGIKIPGDICIIGFNNDPLSLLVEPGLSTINYPGRKIGELAAGNMLALLNGNHQFEPAEKFVVPSELIIRESSLRIRK